MDYLHYLDILDQCDEEFMQNNRQPKVYKPRVDPFELNEADFKNKYTFSKSYVRKIVDLIKNDITKDRRGSGISPELQVLTAIKTWARQEIQENVADVHGLSQQSVTNICRRVAIALASKSSQFIYMPNSIQQEEEVIAGFREIGGFHNVIGAIDCTHVKIKNVRRPSAQFYNNRKGFYSVNVQVICDHKLKIRDIVAWRGSTYDSKIFKESSILERFENKEFHGRLLGDSGYALTDYLFTPVLYPLSSKEEAYNIAHIQTHNAIERCFGVWKQRFRCLLTGFTVSYDNVKIYLVALAVLHNIAIDMGENIDISEYHIEENNRVTNHEYSYENQNGQTERQIFIERYFY